MNLLKVNIFIIPTILNLICYNFTLFIIAVSKRLRVDLTASSLERNFITPVRAMSDFLLKPADLETLPKTKRRSPYELEPPITVYWRRDVEAKANEVGFVTFIIHMNMFNVII